MASLATTVALALAAPPAAAHATHHATAHRRSTRAGSAVPVRTDTRSAPVRTDTRSAPARAAVDRVAAGPVGPAGVAVGRVGAGSAAAVTGPSRLGVADARAAVGRGGVARTAPADGAAGGVGAGGAGAGGARAGEGRTRQEPPGGSAPTIVHVPPVDGPVVDPFRPPPGPYGPGNRGLEYDTEPGTTVRASAAGTVVFAGTVAGSRHVTVRHADGVRTSYSYLAALAVVRGQRVEQGERLGTAGERLHFGARMGDAYFDPALLFGAAPAVVELVPFEIPPGSSPAAEGEALVQLGLGDGDGGPGLGPALPGTADAARWLRDRAATAAHYAARVGRGGAGALLVAELGRRLLFPGPCSDEPPPRRPAAAGAAGRQRVAITVAGLGSSSTTGSIDELRTAELGYADDRVVRFSYAGGKVPGTGRSVDVPARDYASADTQGDLRVAGARLADLVVAVLAAEPAATADLLAHSQGGVVARLAVLELAERGVDLGRLGLVATIGTPHRGADLATAVVAANGRLSGNLALDRLEAAVGTGIDPDAPAVAQLAETSPLMGDLRRRGVPGAVRLLSVAARGDWVVAAPNTVVPGATNVTVPVSGRDAHGDVVAADATTEALARALAGQPPACEDVGDVVADVLVGHGLSAVEDAAGAAVLAGVP